jgi:acetyltransferase-like isoleucine patch superfamily enzyme
MRPLPAMTAELLQIVRSLREDPAAAGERLRRIAGRLRARWLFRRCDLGAGVCAWRAVRVVARGYVKVDDGVQFWSGPIPQELVSLPGAEIVIGADSMFNAGVSIRAAQHVRIGARCLFGALALVRDEENGRTAPVDIADDVWIGHGAIVCPGVSVGRGSVVGAGSVVRADVPPASLAVGNPATVRPLRPLDAPPRR